MATNKVGTYVLAINIVNNTKHNKLILCSEFNLDSSHFFRVFNMSNLTKYAPIMKASKLFPSKAVSVIHHSRSSLLFTK